jgi:hypothetical protein
MTVIRAAGIFALALLFLGASRAEALTLEKVGDFDQPTYVAGDPSNANRIFVVERKGRIKSVENGVVTTFADFGPSLSCPDECPNDRGLMSIAVAPDFRTSGRLYVDYASNLDGNVHIDEFVSPGPNHATATSARNLAIIPFLSGSLHFGGQLQLGRDGDLYVTTGDGGDGNGDPFHNAQDPTGPLGKLLRIDLDASPPTYTAWSLGLRNPFRFSFDRQSGDLVIADVGDTVREEIDFAPSPGGNGVGGQGANYGWNCREGGVAGPATDPQCATAPLSSFTSPVFEYTTYSQDPDLGGKRCSIIGGYVVRDPGLAELGGRYLYSDYCSGVLRSLQLPSTASGQATGDCSLGLRANGPVSFGEDAAARLYLVEQDGGVYRLAAGGSSGGCAPAEKPIVKKATTPTFVGIKPLRRRVERGRRALLTVWVSPCKGRIGESVGLMRNGHRNGTKALSRACTARFAPKIGTGTRFSAFTHEVDEYLPGTSRQLTIRIAHHQRKRH